MSLIIPTSIETAIVGTVKAAVFLAKKWRWFVVFAGIVLFFVLVGFVLRWSHRPPKLDTKQIQRAQTAIATADREEMTKVLVESDVREKNIDANVANSETQTVNAEAESRKQWANASNNEMAAELERRAQEP